MAMHKAGDDAIREGDPPLTHIARPTSETSSFLRMNVLIWVCWWLMLFACPITIKAIAIANWRSNIPWGDPAYSPEPRNWVGRIYVVSLVLSALLAATAGYFGRGVSRWIALIAVAIMLPITWCFYFEACMATTGMWL